MTYTVGYMIGSLSAVSINRILARSLVRLAPREWTMVEIPIKDLPLYNRDLDSDYPPEARALKDAIAGVDAVLFVTPSTTGTSLALSRTPSTGLVALGGRIPSRASRRQ
jgi:NAD(P)H-dependent FMN reductase